MWVGWNEISLAQSRESRQKWIPAQDRSVADYCSDEIEGDQHNHNSKAKKDSKAGKAKAEDGGRTNEPG